jgi:hypothetical protein
MRRCVPWRPEATLDEGRKGLTIEVTSWPVKSLSKALAVALLRLRGRRVAAAAPLSLAFAHKALVSRIVGVEGLSGPYRRALRRIGRRRLGRHDTIRRGTRLAVLPATEANTNKVAVIRSCALGAI